MICNTSSLFLLGTVFNTCIPPHNFCTFKDYGINMLGKETRTWLHHWISWQVFAYMRAKEFWWVSLLTKLWNLHVLLLAFCLCHHCPFILSALTYNNPNFSTYIKLPTFNNHDLVMILENVKILEVKSNLA